jgi:hypothetical protein
METRLNCRSSLFPMPEAQRPFVAANKGVAHVQHGHKHHHKRLIPMPETARPFVHSRRSHCHYNRLMPAAQRPFFVVNKGVVHERGHTNLRRLPAGPVHRSILPEHGSLVKTLRERRASVHLLAAAKTAGLLPTHTLASSKTVDAVKRETMRRSCGRARRRPRDGDDRIHESHPSIIGPDARRVVSEFVMTQSSNE